MRKPSHREVDQFAWRHPAGRWQQEILNPSCLAKSCVLRTCWDMGQPLWGPCQPDSSRCGRWLTTCQKDQCGEAVQGSILPLMGTYILDPSSVALGRFEGKRETSGFEPAWPSGLVWTTPPKRIPKARAALGKIPPSFGWDVSLTKAFPLHLPAASLPLSLAGQTRGKLVPASEDKEKGKAPASKEISQPQRERPGWQALSLPPLWVAFSDPQPGLQSLSPCQSDEPSPPPSALVLNQTPQQSSRQ